MNIRQLETFHWIAQLGSFSAAAERLHTSQANVSTRIRELEEDLGVLLFDRIGREVHLTLKGRDLLPHAQRVVFDAAQLRLAAGKPEVVASNIKIGLGEVIAAQSLVTIIHEVKHHYPDAEIEFDIDLNQSLVRKLVRGAVDVAVLGGPIDCSDIQLMPIGDMALTWIGAASLWQGTAIVTPRDLVDQPIMSMPRDAILHTRLLDWFATAGLAPRHLSFCNKLATMIDTARAGLSLSIVPMDLAMDDLEGGHLRALTPSPALARQNFYVATRQASVDPAIPGVAAMVAKATRQPTPPDMSAGAPAMGAAHLN